MKYKIGDLVFGKDMNTKNKYIGVIVAIHNYNYTVYFPCAPNSYWNDGIWTPSALEMVNESR